MLTEKRKSELVRNVRAQYRIHNPTVAPLDIPMGNSVKVAIETALAESEHNLRTVLATRLELAAQAFYHDSDANGGMESVFFAQAFSAAADIVRGDE